MSPLRLGTVHGGLAQCLGLLQRACFGESLARVERLHPDVFTKAFKGKGGGALLPVLNGDRLKADAGVGVERSTVMPNVLSEDSAPVANVGNFGIEAGRPAVLSEDSRRHLPCASPLSLTAFLGELR